ncbi:hypothetical protein Tco_0462899 [Tanacetum coccineum]
MTDTPYLIDLNMPHRRLDTPHPTSGYAVSVDKPKDNTLTGSVPSQDVASRGECGGFQPKRLAQKTAKYGKIWYDEDVYNLKSVENEFPAIVFNDNLTSNETPSCKHTVSSLNNNEIDFRISFDESDDDDYTVVFDKNSFSYKIISTSDLKTDLENDNEKFNMHLSPEPTVSCIDDLDFFKDFENEFPAIVYNDALTSKSDFSTEPTLCPQHINEFYLKDETSLSEYDEVEQNILIQHMALPPRDQRNQYLRFEGLQYIDADIADFETRLAKIYRREGCSGAEFGEAVLDLDTAEAFQFYETDPRQGGSECLLDRDLVCGGFSGYTPSYTLIRNPILRLCHRLIACSIVGTSQAPEKVNVTDLFYLKGIDVGSANVPYLLARYLRLFASGRKQGAMISGDMAELVRLQICVKLDDIWAWVLAGPARQEGDAGGVADDASVAPGGGDEDEEMPQASQREVLDSMARDFSRFTTWTVTSLARLMDRAGVPYTRYSESPVEYQRRTRQRTDGANTSTAPQQPDP